MNINKLAGITAATIVASFALQAREASAVTVYPKASNYQVKFVKAYDPCAGPGVTVVNPGAIVGCTLANTVTSGITFQQAALKVGVSKTKGASLQLKGKGFVTVGQKIGVQLTIRTSNPAGAPTITFADRTIICGPTAGGTCGHYTAVDAKGKIKSGKVFLTACLTGEGLNNTLAHGNIEIVDSALIDCDTGQVFATPGIQQP